MAEAPDNSLETAWQRAGDGPVAEAAFLRELSARAVLVILQQPPGPGAAAPEKNLVTWSHDLDGGVFVPMFTDATHVPFPVSAPAQLIRVSTRVLLAAGGKQHYRVNPMSSASFVLDSAHVAQVRAYIAARSLESEAPSREIPWAFRLPDDALYPVALALANWFVTTGRVDEAYLYELTRGEARVPQVVLGLNEASDPALADTLKAVAVQAGAHAGTFIVRFLPEEPSHRAGIDGIELAPFYRRPLADSSGIAPVAGQYVDQTCCGDDASDPSKGV